MLEDIDKSNGKCRSSNLGRSALLKPSTHDVPDSAMSSLSRLSIEENEFLISLYNCKQQVSSRSPVANLLKKENYYCHTIIILFTCFLNALFPQAHTAFDLQCTK